MISSTLSPISPAIDTLVIIPARWGSSRFPGKPLTPLAGKSLLERVHDAAIYATKTLPHVAVIVATEDSRVCQHAHSFGANAIITSDQCATGTDRAHATLEALSQSSPTAVQASTSIKDKTLPHINWIINLQGDAPLTPPRVIQQLIQRLRSNPDIGVLTPVTQLSWSALDAFRANKITTPHSGTTVTIDAHERALWFSKQIIPAIRQEATQREQSTLSPVWHHIGLYGYRRDALERFVALPISQYETLEGLEQLRLLENHIPIHTLPVDPNEISLGNMSALSGVDTPEDAERITAWLNQYGDPWL
ncbi:MAG: 3-deoxy-manno-octulosonate cytidylyltransferase [Gammaproteobacteria bacterium]